MAEHKLCSKGSILASSFQRLRYMKCSPARPSSSMDPSAQLLLIQDTCKRIFIKHLSVKGTRWLCNHYSCKQSSCEWFPLAGWTGMFSFARFREVCSCRGHRVIAQCIMERWRKWCWCKAVPVLSPTNRAWGFQWHTPIHSQMNLVLMPLKPSALMLEINTRQMLAKPSAYPPHRATSSMTAPCIHVRGWHFGSHHTFPALTHRLPLKPQHKHQQGHQRWGELSSSQKGPHQK